MQKERQSLYILGILGTRSSIQVNLEIKEGNTL
jgi:hypothetical protein